MKTVLATVGALLALTLVSCNPELQSSTKSSPEEAVELIVFNAFELKEDSNHDNDPVYTLWVRTADKEVPYYIFVNLDQNRKVHSYYGLDWRDAPFKFDSYEITGSDNPIGVSPVPDYGTDGNKLMLYVDEFCVPGKGEIIVQLESFPVTIDDLQKIIDKEPLDFAWNRVNYPGSTGGGRVKIASAD